MSAKGTVPAQETVLAEETISAAELHRVLVTANRIGARARLRFIRALLALDRTRLHVELGFSTTAQYASSEFGYQKSEVYESLRAARALESLPRSSRAFQAGRLSWSALKEITRVASADTEEEWIAFARTKTFEELRAEVLDARRTGRKRPRRGRYGLPRLRVRITFELEPEQHVLVQKALEKVASSLRPCLDGERPRPQEALLYLAHRVLEGEPSGQDARAEDGAGLPPGEGGPPAAGSPVSPFTVLLRVCPSCRVSHVATPEGYVEIAEESVSRVEGDARRVEIPPDAEIEPVSGRAEEKGERGASRTEGLAAGTPAEKDRPNSAALTRRVLLRDGARCANPYCGRTENLQAHHIRFRSQGGPTELHNEVIVCDRCHATIHLGFLEVTGNPVDGLSWRPAVRRLDRTLSAEAEQLEKVPVVIAQATTGLADSGIPEWPNAGLRSGTGTGAGTETETGTVALPLDVAERYSGPVRALEALGYRKADAKSLVVGAYELLRREKQGDEPGDANTEDITEEAILSVAVRAGRREAPPRRGTVAGS